MLLTRLSNICQEKRFIIFQLGNSHSLALSFILRLGTPMTILVPIDTILRTSMAPRQPREA